MREAVIQVDGMDLIVWYEYRGTRPKQHGALKRTLNIVKISNYSFSSESVPSQIIPMPSIEQEVVFFKHHRELKEKIPDERSNNDLRTGQ